MNSHAVKRGRLRAVVSLAAWIALLLGSAARAGTIHYSSVCLDSARAAHGLRTTTATDVGDWYATMLVQRDLSDLELRVADLGLVTQCRQLLADQAAAGGKPRLSAFSASLAAAHRTGKSPAIAAAERSDVDSFVEPALPLVEHRRGFSAPLGHTARASARAVALVSFALLGDRERPAIGDSRRNSQ